MRRASREKYKKLMLSTMGNVDIICISIGEAMGTTR